MRSSPSPHPCDASPWLAVAVADRQPGRADARVRAAAPIDEPTARTVAADLLTVSDEIEWTDGALVTRRIERLGSIELSDGTVARPPIRCGCTPPSARGCASEGLDALSWTEAARDLRARLDFLRADARRPVA